jgi:hypothetical protein
MDPMKRLIWLLLVGAAPANAQPSALGAEPPPRRTPFDQGRFGLSFGAGSQTVLGDHYYGVAGGAGYYVLDGVEVGLGTSLQWGTGPTITRVTPSLRYVAQPLVGRSPLIPYAGVFGSHYFIGEDNPDVNTVGARAGLLYVGGSLVVGLGVAVEHVVSRCNEDTEDCTDFYPDFTLSFAL